MGNFESVKRSVTRVDNGAQAFVVPSESASCRIATTSKRVQRLVDAYAFPRFRPQPKMRGVFGDPKACVISLVRLSQKQVAAAVVACSPDGTPADPQGARSVLRRPARVPGVEVRRIQCRVAAK